MSREKIWSFFITYEFITETTTNVQTLVEKNLTEAKRFGYKNVEAVLNKFCQEKRQIIFNVYGEKIEPN